jgi:hypothetical protein
MLSPRNASPPTGGDSNQTAYNLNHVISARQRIMGPQTSPIAAVARAVDAGRDRRLSSSNVNETTLKRTMIPDATCVTRLTMGLGRSLQRLWVEWTDPSRKLPLPKSIQPDTNATHARTIRLRLGAGQPRRRKSLGILEKLRNGGSFPQASPNTNRTPDVKGYRIAVRRTPSPTTGCLPGILPLAALRRVWIDPHAEPTTSRRFKPDRYHLSLCL